jgi:hypothetical protein
MTKGGVETGPKKADKRLTMVEGNIGLKKGGVETGQKKADKRLTMVEGNIGLKKGDGRTRIWEQLQLEVEPPSGTRPE